MAEPEPTAGAKKLRPRPCPICGGAPLRTYPYINDDPAFAHAFDGLTIVVCRECGFGDATPRVPDEALAAYYASSYAPRFLARVAGGDWPFFDERSVAQLMIARHFVDFAPGDAFVDLGPGAGAALWSAGRLLDRPRLVGVELGEASIALIRRNMPETALVARIEDAPEAAGAPIKLMLSSHSLEHFNGDEVVPTLRRANEALAPGGGLLVEVPHWDLRRNRARVKDTPHLGFFSQPALERALEAAGFRVALSNLYGIPRGAPKDYDALRRAEIDWAAVKGPGAQFLRIAIGAEMRPTGNGSKLRAMAVKPA